MNGTQRRNFLSKREFLTASKNPLEKGRNVKIIYLVRHCQTTGQEPDAPLTERGFEQAETLAAWFDDKPVARIVSSPYRRAVQSASPLAQQRGVLLETDERLREWNSGAGQFPDWQNRVMTSYNELDHSWPNSESGRRGITRVVAAVMDILAADTLPAVVVTHGGLLTLLLKHFDDTVGYEEWQRLTNPDVFLLRYQEEQGTTERLWEG
jgi:2,3-bisphosphoglycerate-dependent phosphoglycerate mutase